LIFPTFAAIPALSLVYFSSSSGDNFLAFDFPPTTFSASLSAALISIALGSSSVESSSYSGL
jgi:hypothetical protein